VTDLPTTDDSSLVHVRIAAARRPDYWLHLAINRMITLDTMDAYLRDLWLECCGHMSGFTVDGVQYTKPYSEDESRSMFGVEQRSMDVPLATVLDADAADQNQEFTYEYDFGTTTELTIRIVDTGSWDVAAADLVVRSDDVPDIDGVHLLARNEPPRIECGECGASATKVCQSCLFEIGPDAWLCEDCAESHTAVCEHPAFLPRVNSPRTGVCGYTG
jgi:hypothetical protein